MKKLLALLIVLATPAGAGGPFKAPEGCEVYVTVQMRSCQVSQHYRCAADPAGDQWGHYADGQGPYFLNRIDAETRWLDSLSLISGESDRLIAESDPASFTTLISGGRDDYDFTTRSNNGELLRIVGSDRLTGESVVIDGVKLERTKFELAIFAEDGSQQSHRRGVQLIHRDWRLFFADTDTVSYSNGDVIEGIDTPVGFATKGAPGYLDDQPKFDCDVVTAAAAPNPRG